MKFADSVSVLCYVVVRGVASYRMASSCVCARVCLRMCFLSVSLLGICLFASAFVFAMCVCGVLCTHSFYCCLLVLFVLPWLGLR